MGDGLSERARASSPDPEPDVHKPSFKERLSVSLRLIATALRNPRIRAVLLAFLLFSIAEWARWVALLVYGFDRAGPTGSGLMSVLQLAPAAAITPFTSSLADRYPRARVLMFAYLVSGVADLAAATALRAGAPFLVVAAFALIGTTGILMIRPTMSSLMPSLASTPDELTAANVSSTFIVGGSLFVGPLIAAGTLLVAGPAAILAITGAGLALGGLLLMRIPAEPVAGEAGDARVAVLGGFRELGRERGGGLIVGLMALQAATWGMLDVLIVTLAIRTLNLGQSGAGLLSGVMGIGGLIGGAFAVILVGRKRLSPAFALGVALWSFPLIVIGLLLAPVPTLVMLAVSGAGFSLLDVSGRTLLQRLIPDEMLGRVFGLLESGFMAAWGVGSLVAPVSLKLLGTRWTLAVAGCLLPVASAVSWRTLAERRQGGSAAGARARSAPRDRDVRAAAPCGDRADGASSRAGHASCRRRHHQGGRSRRPVLRRLARHGPHRRRRQGDRARGPRRLLRRDRTAPRRPANGDGHGRDGRPSTVARPGALPPRGDGLGVERHDGERRDRSSAGVAASGRGSLAAIRLRTA